MANPTNINVPPAKAADPTNVNVPVHGTKFPGGVSGSDSYVKLSGGGTNRATGDTNFILDEWLAATDGYFRKGYYLASTVTATATFDIINVTQGTTIVATVTPTAVTGAAITFASQAVQSFNEGDVIRLRDTTSGVGVLGNVNVHLFYTELNGSATNPV